MKRIVKKSKIDRKLLLGIILGIMISTVLTCTFVYAVGSVIESKSVLYNRTISGGSSDNVQGSIDELYKMSGVSTTLYKEEILNGADPVLGKDMIPVTLDGDGTVKYANLNTPWYKYAEKRWANAVILVGNPSKNYKTGDIILEKDIESYFVWVPRFKYKIWDLGNYTSAYSLSQLKDNADKTETNLDAFRHITSNARIIDIVFENKNTTPSTTVALNSYYTHPAFIAFDVNGLWIGKFETGYNQGIVGKPIEDTLSWTPQSAQQNIISSDHIIVKPNVYSWRTQIIGNIFKNLYNYRNISGNHNTNLDPHMIKNTEWGAAAYLSHSAYGIGNEVNINNNTNRITGYSAAPNTIQTSNPGTIGTESSITKPYNTPTGYLASTTGNITGIYDMSGGVWEYVAAYMEGHYEKTSDGISSGFTSSDLSDAKYLEKYSNKSDIMTYNLSIFGDAMREMGPFYSYVDKDGGTRQHNAWYGDDSRFINSQLTWFARGGFYNDGESAGQFCFLRWGGYADERIGSRLVLAVK